MLAPSADASVVPRLELLAAENSSESPKPISIDATSDPAAYS
jgi:hypothetical protein